MGQAHFKQKPWSLVRDFTGGGEGGGEEEEQVLAVKDDYVGVDQNLFQGILVALRGDQDHRVGSFDIFDTSPKAILDSQAEWSGGLVGSSTSRG